MVKTNNKWNKDFFIKLSSLSIKQNVLVESLLYNAMQACFSRDKARQFAIGEWLCDLSPRFEHIGRWHLALSAPAEKWSKGSSDLRHELESLGEKAPLEIRALALNSLAGLDIRLNSISQITQSILKESLVLSSKSRSVLGYLQAQSNASLLYSINGDDKESLNILRGIQPIVDRLGSCYDALKLDIHNSIACDLLQSGNPKAAAYFIKSPLNSVHISAYPEWQQTAFEISAALPQKSNIFYPPSHIFKGYFNPETFQEYQEKREFFSEPEKNLLPAKEIEPNLSIYINHRRYGQISLSQNRELAQKAMQIFLFIAEKFSTRPEEKGTIFFETYFYSCGVYCPIAEHTIRYEYLDLFDHLITQVNELSKSKPTVTQIAEKTSPEEVAKAWGLLKPMVDKAK